VLPELARPADHVVTVGLCKMDRNSSTIQLSGGLP
jgi:hypothetical protein